MTNLLGALPAIGGAGSASESASTSFVPQYQEEPFLNQIAQYAGQVGNNVYNWAQNAYQGTSGVTNANIQNYLGTSANALGQANNLTNQYENILQPEENQLARDADTYASTNRIQSDMGAAESQAAQAGAANHANTVRDLRSFGIDTGDPSSGRYAALDNAEAVQNAATEAGAAQQARNFDITTGQQLRQAAVQDAETKPGQIINAENTGLQGFTGAENASLANANTGVALQGAANPYLNTASSLKYPPLGNESASASISNSPVSGGGGGGSGGGSSPRSPSSPSGAAGQSSPSSPGSPGSSSPGSPGGSNSPAQWSPAPGGGDPTGDPFGDLGGISNSDGSYGMSDGSSPDTLGGAGYNGDPTGGYTANDYGMADGSSPDTFGGAGYNSGDSGGVDTGSSGFDSGGMEGFAEGGVIDDTGAIPDDGGQIPQSASPSGGMQTDDIPAQGPGGPIKVNANEFVIPQDVALWKGQEFFQKLIAQSRQARLTAPAHPQMR